MKIEEGIELALSGNAILFTGAGFSIDAQNLRGTSFKTGSQLSEYLSGLVDIDEKLTLDAAAEEFISVNGKDELIKELHNEFTAKTITSFQSQIAQIPWKRVYTTNYDNVLEKAYAENGKKLSPIVSSDNIRDVPLNKTVCVHLNGWIDDLDRSTLMSEFKLTETSYLTTSIESSPWGTLFRDDIRSARSVFFVGYSLADLDIKRLLIESETLREKCFFVLGNSPGKATTRICSKFGQVTNLDVSAFATEIQNISKNYVPPAITEFSSNSIEKYQTPKEQKAFSDKDIFALFLQGTVNESFLIDSLSGEKHYFLERPEINKIIEQ